MSNLTPRGQELHMPDAIGDYFQIEGHILSTRTADAHKALDKTRQESVCLWLMRHPLSVGSDAVQRFVKRMESIEDVTPAVSRLKSFGVDKNGIAFAVFPPLDGHAVAAGNIEASEGERRFISCLRYVDKLHKAGIVCGDLCGNSFWVDRGGDVSVIGLMGSFDAEAAATAMLPPPDTMPYLAPEQQSGGSIEIATDVFSLGVLGYFMLTGQYPYGNGPDLFMSKFDVSQVRPVRSFVDIPPIWGDEVLSRCLHSDPSQRFQSAGAILDHITSIRERSFSKEQAPKSTIGGNMPKQESAQSEQSGAQHEGLTTAPAIRRPAAENLPATTVSTARVASKLALAALVVLVAVFGVLVGKQMAGSKVSVASNDNDSYPTDVGNPDIKGPIGVMKERTASQDEKALQIEKLKDSDDPVAHHFLIKTAKTAESPEIRDLAEKALINRARRKGLSLSAEQIKQWLRTVEDPLNTPSYDALLKVVDFSLPQADRDALLREAYPANPVLVMRLAIALAFDLDALEEFQPVLSQLIGDSLELDDASQYSSLALIVAHKDLALIFEDKIVQNRDSLTDADVGWVLEILARRDDVNTRAVANLALERELLPPVQADLLKIVRDRSDLSPAVASAIIHAATGTVQAVDVQAFGRWYDIEVEKILLSILAIADGLDIKREAFDTLAGKSPTIQPSADLLAWVRTNHWSKRADFANVIGILGLSDKFSIKEQNKAFEAFDAFLDDRETLLMLLELQSPPILRYLLEKHAYRIDLGNKLNMVRSVDKYVRMAAIDSIETNDVGALKIIVDAYEREKDPEVKEKFKKFWVIKEREEG
jgi:hypothetical protein